MRASVFVGTSLDGFIARKNGSLDFLPTVGGDPNGYEDFIATIDACVIGRKTTSGFSVGCDGPVGAGPTKSR